MAVVGANGISQFADPVGTAALLMSNHVSSNEPHGSRTTMPIDPRTGPQTLAATDKGHTVTSGDSGDVVYTVPSGVFGAGDVVYVRQGGAGVITFAGAATNLGTKTQTAELRGLAIIHFQSASTYDLDGDVV